MNTVITISDVWEQNKHLNFGEIRQVVEAAERAANDKVFEIAQSKIRAANHYANARSMSLTRQQSKQQ